MTPAIDHREILKSHLFRSVLILNFFLVKILDKSAFTLYKFIQIQLFSDNAYANLLLYHIALSKDQKFNFLY